MDIPIAETRSIRECGLNEYWLQDQIYDNPACLGLGDLEAVAKERVQGSGGRLDLLLKNPEDDSMYEVEVMLGETDESHIIRTIEYWDNEKRRWPQRQHYAVLVAECVTKRFFNVIQLLSQSIPIIAIQVNVVASEGRMCLHFSKILDTYEEVEDGAGIERVYDEAYWLKRSAPTVGTAKALAKAIEGCYRGITLKYLQQYIALSEAGENSFRNHFWMRKRKGEKSLLGFQVADDRAEEVGTLLDDADISFTRKQRQFRFILDEDFVSTHADTLRAIAMMVKGSRE